MKYDTIPSLKRGALDKIVIILKNTDLLLRMKGKSLLMLLKQAKSLKPKCI